VEFSVEPDLKLVVEAHKGRIWVESAWGEGSTSIARLPRQAQNADSDA
jgi:signal transduction histidine kinase